MFVGLLGLGNDEFELLFVELVLCRILIASNGLNLLELIHPIPKIVLLLQLVFPAQQESFVADAMGALLAGEPSEGFEDGLAHLSVVAGLVGRNLEVSLLLVAVEGALDRVDERDLEEVEEDLPGGEVAAAPEPVGPVVEPLVVLADHHGEDLDEVGEMVVVVGIEEGAQLAGVRVQVQHHLAPVLLNQLLYVVNDGLVVPVRVCPLPVGIAADELRSSISVHNSVDVDHWHNLKHEMRQQVLSLL